MEPVTLIILLTAILGFYMAWNIGANDVANSMGCAVGSKSISIKKAVIAAGFCEFAGAVLVGAHVTDTVRKGIVDPNAVAQLEGLLPGEGCALLVLGMGSALLAAAIWLNVATWLGMPVSTTHSIVGAVTGFGIVAAGWSAVHWGKLGQIVASWFISPVVGGILGYVIFRIISSLILGRRKPSIAAGRITPYIVFFMVVVVVLSIVYKGLKHLIKERADWITGGHAVAIACVVGFIVALISKALITRALRSKHDLPLQDQLRAIEAVFAPLVVISSCSVAFSHGANDVANAIGPLAAIVDIMESHTIKMKVTVPFWVLALGGAGIVSGLAVYGYRVMKTIGEKITEITPTRGVAASIAATTTVLACTRMQLPVSTTHTLVGAVLGIGLARGLAGVNRQVTRNIFGSWLVTVPVAAVLAIILFVSGRALFLSQLREIICTP